MKKFFLVALTAFVLALVATAYMAFTKPPFSPTYYADTNVQCLPRGHRDLAIAWRMQLSIFVDGVAEALPQNIGNTIPCTTELHTHEAGDLVHAEFYTKKRSTELTVNDFFAVWGVSPEREGYALEIKIGDQPVDSIDDVTIKNKQAVVLTYTAIATSTKLE